MNLPARKDQALLTVVQISDCHLGAQLGDSLLGMDTDNSLELVLSIAWLESARILICWSSLVTLQRMAMRNPTVVCMRDSMVSRRKCVVAG